MTKEHTPEEIKNWLSNIGGVIGIIALKYIAALEKENDELKKESKFYYEERCNYKAAFLKEVVKKNKINKALIKAKEIIKKFLLWENDWHTKTESKYELLKQADEFLKENENDSSSST